MTKRYCDRCGKEVKGKFVKLNEINIKGEGVQYELCMNCFYLVKNFIEGYDEEERNADNEIQANRDEHDGTTD